MGAIYDRYRLELSQLRESATGRATGADPVTVAAEDGRAAGFQAAGELAEALGPDALVTDHLQAVEAGIEQALGLNIKAQLEERRDPDAEWLQAEAERTQAYYDAFVDARDALVSSCELAPATTLEELTDVLAFLNSEGHQSAADLFAGLASEKTRLLPSRDPDLKALLTPLWAEADAPAAADLAADVFAWQERHQRPDLVIKAVQAMTRPELKSLEVEPLGQRSRLSPLAAPEQSL